MSIMNGLILLAVLAGVIILTGAYVFFDARRRGMHAFLWMMIAVLVPSLIGLLVYLLIRSSHSDLKCPACATAVTEQFNVCPSCGAKLRAVCPQCGSAIETGWKVCPLCTQPLPEFQSDIQPPVRREDHGIGKVLLTVVLVPVILILVLIYIYNSLSFSAAVNTTYCTAEHYADEPEILQWLERCEKADGGAYALRHKTEHSGQPIIQYLVYLPDALAMDSLHTDLRSSLLGPVLEVSFEEDLAQEEFSHGYALCCISVYTDVIPRLEVRHHDERIDSEITDVDYNLTFFELTSE